MVFRVHMSFPYDSALPRDRIQLTPHFFGTDAGALANALKTNLMAWGAVATRPFTIKVYDAEKAAPSYPLVTVEQTGTTPTTSAPREIACCLSYYSTWNRPRTRGRLYLPCSWLTGAPLLRPTPGVLANVLTFGTDVLAKQLPASHNWVVWSRADRQAHGVTNIWADDEWDTVRSRGLRATTRVLGTV